MRQFLRALALAILTAAPLAAQDRPTAGFVSGPMVGDRAPDFSLPWASVDGAGGAQWFSLSGQRGQVVVLAFYPKDFTSGCTAQMEAFRDQYAELFGDGVVVAGISADSIETHVRFAQSIAVPFKLLSDPDQKVSRAWASAGDNGYNKRTIYVINRQGKVTYTDRRFGALDPKAYAALREAVQLAKR